MNERSEQDLEQALRRSLTPADPGEVFTQRVLARLPAQGRPRAVPRARARRAVWMSAALAASLVLAVTLRHQSLERREVAQGLYAKQQLLVALRITNEQLDLAHRSLEDRSQ